MMQTNKKITIIDGNSLMFRAFYAPVFGKNKTQLHNKEGIPTNAIFVFLRMLEQILKKVDQYLVIVFDQKKPTLKHQKYSFYKQNRKKIPDALVQQIPFIFKFIDYLGIKSYSQEEVEADDIIGTLASYYSKLNFTVNIFSSDKDFFQLVDQNISFHFIKKGITNIEIITPELILEKFGLNTNQMIDFKALIGDKSDNISGAIGIGEKTAQKLLVKFHNVDNLLAKIEEIDKPKIQNIISKNVENIKISKELVTINKNVMLNFAFQNVENILIQKPQQDKISFLCQKLDFQKLAKYYETKFKNRQ